MRLLGTPSSSLGQALSSSKPGNVLSVGDNVAVLREDHNGEMYAELGRVTELFMPGLRKMSSAVTKKGKPQSAAKVTASMRRSASVDIEREQGYMFRMGSYEAAEKNRGGVPEALRRHLKAASRPRGDRQASKRSRTSSPAMSATHRLGDLFRWVGNVSTSIEDLAPKNLLANGLVLEKAGDQEGAFFLLDTDSKAKVIEGLGRVAKQS